LISFAPVGPEPPGFAGIAGRSSRVVAKFVELGRRLRPRPI
jgi:hypothetical protein